MLNNVALDVVIGLLFIYLLYSLLVTVLAEIIATKLGLRARNLKEAVDRMLNDEQATGWFYRLWDSLKFTKNPNNPTINNFYNHPEIKYLGSTGLFRNPSSFKAVSFSKTLLYLLNGTGPLNPENIENELRSAAPTVLGVETAGYVLSIWEDSERDVTNFKLQLEAWFDRSMEQATEWYKRKIQVILLFLGFIVAWIFNADTVSIVKKLSRDEGARGQIVQLASAYLENHPARPVEIAALLDSADAREYKEKMDSLLAVKKQIETDINATQSFMGAGSWLPDSVHVSTDKKTLVITYTPAIEPSLLKNPEPVKDGYMCFTGPAKWSYFFNVLGKHWPGFLLTALAISLGAPFWFDLLNKVMKLRTSIKQPSKSTNTNSDNTVLPSDSF